MIISDLEVLETVSEENIQVTGGTDWKKKPSRKPYRPDYKKAEASADAEALAIGKVTSTNASTYTEAVAGVYSYSGASSSSSAKH